MSYLHSSYALKSGYIMLLGFLLQACSPEPAATLPTIQLEPGSSREVAFTNQEDVFWATRAGTYHQSLWDGLFASKRAYFEDLFIQADGELLPRKKAVVTVTPADLTRRYPALGITETWTLLDAERTLLVELQAEQPRVWQFQPALLGGSGDADFSLEESSYALAVHLKKMAGLTQAFSGIQITSSARLMWQPAVSPERPLHSAWLSPSGVTEPLQQVWVAIGIGDAADLTDAGDLAAVETALAKRRQRLREDGKRLQVTSGNPSRDQAVAWAHQSLNALIMNQQGRGIYAGLPWFDDYWGRDTFIAFAGAVLVSGRFETAREILRAFADLQNQDTSDVTYGRIPNRARPDDIIYNTADGTPWFVRSVWDYYRYTGDTEFTGEMWPVIQRATRGALKNWTDTQGLMTHGDADTWMDAKGPDGPWSPRGDRAIEIQFLWRDQLEITRRLADRYGDEPLEEEAAQALENLAEGLKLFRIDSTGCLADHLNSDGSQDLQIRPNALLVPPLLSATCDWPTFRTLAPQLVTPAGVLSLAQHDANFHPYHLSPRLYVKDAAYHNGVIWTWNSAAVITPAIHFRQEHYARALFDGLTRQILDRGGVGTLSELLDAWPQDGLQRVSGTFSQAWSLGEYLRVYYQDILGVRPNLVQQKVTLAPRLFSGMAPVSFKAFIGDDTWDIQYNETGNQFIIVLKRRQSHRLTLLLDVVRGDVSHRLQVPWSDQTLRIVFEKQMGQWTVPDAVDDYAVSTVTLDTIANMLPFCGLDTNRIVPALQGPGHRLLSEEEVIPQQDMGTPWLRLPDAAGDDHGLAGNYQYPENPEFEAGLADIREFSVQAEKDTYLFTLKFSHLADPGWHPEYGYQLTYAVIGISYNSGTGTAHVGKNAQAEFLNGFRADQLLYISGGIQLADAEHRVLAEYLPAAATGAIGDAKHGLVRFKLPQELFSGDLKRADFQLAVGIQDDHGGAGIGDFRSIHAVAGEWHGGGHRDSTDTNVYDWLVQTDVNTLKR